MNEITFQEAQRVEPAPTYTITDALVSLWRDPSRFVRHWNYKGAILSGVMRAPVGVGRLPGGAVAAILWHEWRTMGTVSRMSWTDAARAVQATDTQRETLAADFDRLGPLGKFVKRIR